MVSQAGLVVVHLGLAGKSFSVPSAAWWNRSTRRTKGAGRVLSGTMSLMGNAQVHGHVDSYAKCSQTSTAQHSISRPKSDFSTALTTLHTVNDLHFMLQQYWHWKTKINQILTLADFTWELLRQMKKLWYIKRQIINLNEHWLLKEQVLLLMTTCYGETRRYRRWMLCAAMTCGRACHRLLFFNSIGFFTHWATLAEDLRFSRVDWGDDTTELGRPRFVIVEYCVLGRMLTNKHRTAIPAHPHIQDLSKRLILLLLQYRFDRVLPTSTILGQC